MIYSVYDVELPHRNFDCIKYWNKLETVFHTVP